MFHIGMNPDIIHTGSFVLTWHGFLSFVAVALAVYLVARWAPRYGITADDVYAVAIWCIIGGIIGARLVHVVDEWGFYSHNPGQIIAVWNGGIAIWGVPLGGFIGGALYAKRAKLPVGRLADIAAPAVLLAMFVGRFGDIINGEHLAKPTTVPWGFIYTHPASLSFGLGTTHPAIAYEMIWDLIAFGILWWLLKDRLRPEGMLYVAFVALYAFGRFFITFYRADKVWAVGLTEAQFISLAVLVVTVPWLAYRSRFVPRQTPAPTPPARPPPSRSRARRSRPRRA